MRKPRITPSQRAKIERALAQHDRHKDAYLWRPPYSASSRRQTENRESREVHFRHAGHEYRYTSDVSCSCRNYYYCGKFELDGEKKTRRLFAELIK